MDSSPATPESTTSTEPITLTSPVPISPYQKQPISTPIISPITHPICITPIRGKSKEIMDVDSGCENMEVDDATIVPKSTPTSIVTPEHALQVIKRVLLVSWTEPSSEAVYVPCSVDNEIPNYADIISECLMTILLKFAAGSNPLSGIKTDSLLNHSDSMDSSEDLPIMPSTSFGSTEVENKTADPALSYIMGCYSRVANEERLNGKVSSTQIPTYSKKNRYLRLKRMY